jgi:predicted NBD/HSP70 family sugar kinase
MVEIDTRVTSFASYNRTATLDLLRVSGPLTRRQLQDALGLSRTGLATVLDQLLAEGAVAEGDPEVDHAHRRRGRPPRLVSLIAVDEAPTLVLAVRPRRVEAALITSARDIVAVRTAPLPLSAAASESASLLTALGREVLGDATASPGTLALVLPTLVHDDGRIDPHGARELMSSWLDDVSIRRISDEFETPLRVVNETVASALGEALSPANAPARCALYVKVGASGTGMCTLLDGEPFRGATGLAGQLGHVSIRGHGVRCPCGQRGCIAAEIDAQVREEVERRASGSGEGYTVESLVADAVGGDPSTRRLFYDIGAQLAPALGAAINLFEPSLVTIGGDLAEGDTGLMAGLEAELSLSVHPGIAGGLKISPSVLGSKATLIGAARLVASARTPRTVAVA